MKKQRYNLNRPGAPNPPPFDSEGLPRIDYIFGCNYGCSDIICVLRNTEA